RPVPRPGSSRWARGPWGLGPGRRRDREGPRPRAAARGESTRRSPRLELRHQRGELGVDELLRLVSRDPYPEGATWHRLDRDLVAQGLTALEHDGQPLADVLEDCRLETVRVAVGQLLALAESTPEHRDQLGISLTLCLRERREVAMRALTVRGRRGERGESETDEADDELHGGLLWR